jgi:hypothetical protein
MSGKNTALSIRVIAPVKATRRPLTDAWDVQVMDAYARMFPIKAQFALKVADEPTCQTTLLALPTPLVNRTLVLAAMSRAEPIWNIHTALTSPPASRNSCPADSAAAASYLYTPGDRVRPMRSVLVKVVSAA